MPLTTGALETVLVLGSSAEQLHAEALLESAGIPYFSKNSDVQNLLGVGRIGGANVVTGAVAIQVPLEFAREARDLLAGTLEEQPFADTAQELGQEGSRFEAEIHSATDVSRYSKYSIVWSILWLGGIGSLLAIYFGTRALALSRAASAGAGERARAMLGTIFGLIGLGIWFSIWGWQLLR